MGTKSKFFRAFVEGNTISDGRKITADMINDIVATFSAETYTPRINVEHISGYSPEPPFNGYGNVIAVKAQTDDFTIDGKVEKRLALYAQVDANDQLVSLAAKEQKPFPSVELTDSYAGTGKVGLVGLAFTDKPASIGTQALKFSRSAPGTVFAPGTDSVSIEFEALPADPAKVEGAVAGFFAALASKLKGEPAKPPEQPTPPPQPPANDNFATFATEIGQAVASSINTALKPVTDAQTAIETRFAALEQKLAGTEQPNSFSRLPHPGGSVDAKYATDC